MPTVARLSIAPVRSLGLEHPNEIDLTEARVAEDRRFYLVDPANRLIDLLVVPALVQISAHTDPAATQLRLSFPDGTVIDEAVQFGSPSKQTFISGLSRATSSRGHGPRPCPTSPAGPSGWSDAIASGARARSIPQR